MYLRILQGDHLEYEMVLPTLLEIGRQRSREPEPYTFLAATDNNPARLIYARTSESNVSRRHLVLETLEGGKARVCNHSQIRLAVEEPERTSLDPGEARVMTLPFRLALAGRSIAVAAAMAIDDPCLQSLDQQTLRPVSAGEASMLLRPLPVHLEAGKMDELVSWLQTAMGVLQASVGSADFLKRAVEALVQIIGLDSGRVLLLEGDHWKTATALPQEEACRPNWKPSSQVIEPMRRQKRTFLLQPEHADPNNDLASLAGIHVVVAAPLLNARGEVIGALYGERWRSAPTQPSGKLEAMLVDILACGVATGLARQEEETAKVRGRVQFEQFFGPELARQLEINPDLLKDREAEVTLLFCDVRGFARISERIGPASTMRWVSDLLSELSAKVLQHGGVLVDYIGDEMFVMFGAPQEQENHADHAVQAALAMRAALAELNRRWRDMLLSEAMDVGIGINTGLAQVGNSGSRFKYMYGPLGNAINLASRVQRLTKYLCCGLLVTAATYRRLAPGSVLGRRVIRTSVDNIREPVDLYEIASLGDAARDTFFRESEEALKTLESGDFGQAARMSGALLHEHPGDGPMLLVLSRAVDQLINPTRMFDPVWHAPGK